MSIIHDIKHDIREAKAIRLPWWGVLCCIAGSMLISWPLVILGRLDDLGLPVLNSIVVICYAIAVKRKLARYVWFWITMAVLAALHIPLILFVPWTTRWVPALAIAVIDSVDFILILAILAVIRRLVDGPNASEA